MKNLNNRRSDGQKVGRSETTTPCRSGFTLVELVIVIAIVIILSMVSVPIYKNYTYKAKMAEGYALLGLITSAQKTYYAQYGTYLGGPASSAKGNDNFTCNEEVLGIDARSNKYFTAFRVGCNNTSIKDYFDAAVLKPEDLRTVEGKSMIRLFYYNFKAATISESW